MKHLVSIALVLASWFAPASAQGTMEPLSITSSGKTTTFQVEVASSPEARAKGLAGRSALAKDHGLLLDYRNVQEPSSVTMKDVQVELDMIFVDGDGSVIAVATNARPGSLRPIATGLSAAAVLQIAGGQASTLGVKPGDKVKNKMFGNGG